MKWSKLRSLVRQNFAPSISGRLDIHSTAYGGCTCGHAWMTLDGEVIANFCTRAAVHAEVGYAPKAVNPMYQSQFAAYGEPSRQDAYRACWEFVHDLSIDQSLSDDDPLIQSLAIVDRRLGRRRLREVDGSTLHPLARKLLEVRLAAENRASAGVTGSA